MRLEKKSPQKTMSSFAAILLALACALALTGCGGGGGGGGGAAVMPTPGEGDQQMPGGGSNLPEWPVNSDAVLSHLGSATSSSLTPEEVRTRIRSYSGQVGTIGEKPIADESTAVSICLFGVICTLDSEQYEAVATYRDIPLVQALGKWTHNGAFTDLVYGGLLEHGYFMAGEAINPHKTGYFAVTEFPRVDHGNRDDLRRLILRTNARYEGVMVGRDTTESPSRGHVIQGDAEITATLGNVVSQRFNLPVFSGNLEVAFTNIRDLATGGSRPDMEWRISSGTMDRSYYETEYGSLGITDAERYMRLRIIGPNHEEVVGHFHTQDMVGAFGGKRR